MTTSLKYVRHEDGSRVQVKAAIKVGDIVAFNTLDDAVWFDVLKIKGHLLIIREHGTDYATQRMDDCFVKQVREKEND